MVVDDGEGSKGEDEEDEEGAAKADRVYVKQAMAIEIMKKNFST